MSMNVIAAIASAELTAPAAVQKTIHANIPYYSESQRVEYGINDTHRVSLDVYEPNAGSSLPVVIYAHGGAWQRGDKVNVGFKPDFFLTHGFVFVSVNYRFRPNVAIETLPQDVAHAIAWVHNNIGGYRGDNERLVLIGHSAGAHLVSLVALRADLLKSAGISDSNVIKAVVELDTRALDVPLLVKAAPDAFRPVFGDDQDMLTAMSPYHQIFADRYIPPFLFVVANNHEARLAVSNRMREKLLNLKVEAEMIEAPDRTHGSLNKFLGAREDVYRESIVRFLQSHL